MLERQHIALRKISWIWGCRQGHLTVVSRDLVGLLSPGLEVGIQPSLTVLEVQQMEQAAIKCQRYRARV